jgi:hypothetical protein
MDAIGGLLIMIFVVVVIIIAAAPLDALAKLCITFFILCVMFAAWRIVRRAL